MAVEPENCPTLNVALKKGKPSNVSVSGVAASALGAKSIGNIFPGGEYLKVKGVKLRAKEIISSSGLLLKSDPGVPLVYSAFAIILIGGSLSILSTKQLWAISDPNKKMIYVGGLSNRDFSGLAKEIKNMLRVMLKD